MLPERMFKALAGILALSLCCQPPLLAAGKLVSAQNAPATASPVGPAVLPGLSESSFKLSLSAPSLTPTALPDLTLPKLPTANPAANASPSRSAERAVGESSIRPVPGRLTPLSSPTRRESFKKKAAGMGVQWEEVKTVGDRIAETGSAADSHEHGGSIEAFLTGALPAKTELPLLRPDPRNAEGLPPLQGFRGKFPSGLKPANAEQPAPRPRVAEPVIVDDRSGNGLRPSHPFSGFWDLLNLREAQRPGMAAATLAAGLLGFIPGVGAIALHEYGHYLLARLTGAGVSSMHLFIPGGLPSGDGFVTLGFVKIGPPKTPFRNFVLSAAGPAFSAAAFVALTLAVPAAAVTAVSVGWVPGEILPWFALGGSALWSLWYWSAGRRWAFHGGHSDREHMDAARAEMFQYSNQEVRVGPLLGPALAHLQVETGKSAPEVLKHALKLLDEFHAASDRYGWVELEAGNQRFRFPLQSSAADRTPAKASRDYRPLPSPAIPSGEHYYAGDPEVVTIPLNADERSRLRRHKKRLRYSWNSWVFYGALHLYASVLETEKRYGPISLGER